ncbi:MAG: hypothetical protein ACKVT2_20640 [Saprospiraceae bacterium]
MNAPNLEIYSSMLLRPENHLKICLDTKTIFDTKYFFPNRIHTFVRFTRRSLGVGGSIQPSHLPAEAFLPAEALA